MIDHRYFLSLPYLKINYPIMPLWCYPSSGRSMKNTPWNIRNSKIIPLHPRNYNKNSHILLLVVHYIFTIKSISQSQPKAGYIIIYTLTLYHNNQSYNLPTVDYRQELSGYIIFIYGYCPEIKVEVGNMHCRLNHTLSSAYSVRGGYKWVYTISIPISNHNQLCYINSKRIFKGQKEQSAKDYREMIYGFSPGFYRHWSFLPSTMQKKNRNILSLSDCNVTPEYPYNTIKGYEGSIVMILVTLGCIPSDEVSYNFFMSLVPYWVSKQNASIFFLIQSISFK